MKLKIYTKLVLCILVLGIIQKTKAQNCCATYSFQNNLNCPIVLIVETSDCAPLPNTITAGYTISIGPGLTSAVPSFPGGSVYTLVKEINGFDVRPVGPTPPTNFYAVSVGCMWPNVPTVLSAIPTMPAGGLFCASLPLTIYNLTATNSGCTIW